VAPPPAVPATAAPAEPAAPDEPAPVRMTADEVTRTLASLADLRDRGAISPEDYEQKKADLLGRI
jgi:Short C-terminal domain